MEKGRLIELIFRAVPARKESIRYLLYRARDTLNLHGTFARAGTHYT